MVLILDSNFSCSMAGRPKREQKLPFWCTRNWATHSWHKLTNLFRAQVISLYQSKGSFWQKFNMVNYPFNNLAMWPLALLGPVSM